MEELVLSLRPDERRERQARIRNRLLAATGLSDAEIANRMQKMFSVLTALELQRMWEEMFMIDLHSENRARSAWT